MGEFMTNSKITAQDLLDQILKTGREWAEDGKAQSNDLLKRGKVIAAQGEDILADKLGIEDTKAGRDALRKGMGAGAAAGALALLLSSRSGRKMATLGGLAGVGVLAYKAFQKNGGQIPNWKDEVVGMIAGPKGEARSDALLRAMIAAAKADGAISTDEMAIITAHEGEGTAMLEDVLAQEPKPRDIARLADSPQAAREIYAVSCRIADGLSAQERDYLDALAMALQLDPELAARIETNVRTG